MNEILTTKWPNKVSREAYRQHYSKISSKARTIGLFPVGDTQQERLQRSYWWPAVAEPPKTSEWHAVVTESYAHVGIGGMPDTGDGTIAQHRAFVTAMESFAERHAAGAPRALLATACDACDAPSAFSSALSSEQLPASYGNLRPAYPAFGFANSVLTATECACHHEVCMALAATFGQKGARGGLVRRHRPAASVLGRSGSATFVRGRTGGHERHECSHCPAGTMHPNNKSCDKAVLQSRTTIKRSWY